MDFGAGGRIGVGCFGKETASCSLFEPGWGFAEGLPAGNRSCCWGSEGVSPACAGGAGYGCG